MWAASDPILMRTLHSSLAPFVALGLLFLAPAAFANSGGRWLTRAAMGLPRQEVGAARIGDFVYVVGGLTGNPSAATAAGEGYDVHRDQWSPIAPMPVARDHMGVAAADGKLFVIGGFQGDFAAKDEVFMYDPALDQWFPRASLPDARGGCWAVEHGGKIYVFGGVDSGHGASDTTYVYDVQSNVWSQGADMPTAREHLNAVSVGSFIYVIGGRTNFFAPDDENERYDPATNQWQTMAPMPTPRSAMALAALGGKIYAAGGEAPILHAVNEVYDVATNTWSCQDPMQLPRHGIAAVPLDDRILAPGGGVVQGYAPIGFTDTFVPANDVLPYGCGGNPLGSLQLLGGSASIGSSLTFGLDNPLGTQSVGSIPFLAISLAADPGFPCGTLLAGLGMEGSGAPGELLIDVLAPSLQFPILSGAPWAGAGLPAPVVVGIPNQPGLIGLSAFVQGLLFDPIPPSAAKLSLTDAYEVRIQP